MQVLLDSRHPQAGVLRPLAERRVRFVMRRLTAGIPRVHLWLADVNGPRGGVDKQCRVEVQPQGSAPVVVTAVATQWRTAIDLALARAAEVLRRARDRSRRAARRSDSPVATLAAQPSDD